MPNGTSKNNRRLTAQAGMSYVAWQLLRRGWRVQAPGPTAKGSQLALESGSGRLKCILQSRALSKRAAARIGDNLDDLDADWWVVTVDVNTDSPTCYILTRAEVRELASRDKGGKQTCWLEPRNYEQDEFRNAWARIGPGHD